MVDHIQHEALIFSYVTVPPTRTHNKFDMNAISIHHQLSLFYASTFVNSQINIFGFYFGV